MIIIYNVSGLLIGIIGVAVGLFVALLSGWLSAGLLAMAVVWFVAGFWWRNREVSPGVKGAYPALFFIGLPFLAIPVALLSLPFFWVEWNAHGKPADPRAALCRADLRTLDSASATGNAQLSQSILTTLQAVTVEGAKAEKFHVFTRVNPDAVLVLVKAPNLKNFKDNARKQLVTAIEAMLRADDTLKNKRIFIGIKGHLSFGAIRVPPDVVETGSVVSESKLYDFYGDNQTPATNPVKASQPGA